MPDGEIIIKAENLSKAYRIWKTPAARLKSPLLAAAAGVFPKNSGPHRALHACAARGWHDFYALHDISLNVRRGEAIGVIGRNGSGKSTLLQIIAGTLQPTQGRIETRGRIAALLELGAGFNPDFTGRENVYLNAAILGFTRQQVDARIDGIADFAEIGDFIDQPVKTYSSGMVVRLAFAVAANVEPDILIVDEALSVGDARFQLKCARAIDRFIAQGVTLLFVSHDASMVKRLCNHAVLLEHGAVVYAGKPNDVVNLYSKLLLDGNSADSLKADIAALRTSRVADAPRDAQAKPASPLGRPATDAQPDSETVTRQAEALLTDERAHIQVSGQEFAYGGELGRILTVAVLDATGQKRSWFSTGEPAIVRMVVEANDDYPEPVFALTIKNTAGVEIYGTNTLFSKQPAAGMKAGERHVVDFTFDLDIMPGHYFLSFGFIHFVGDKLAVLHRRYDAINLEIHGHDRTFGIANLKAAITSRLLPAENIKLN
ncbi:MAG TPA: ABC transporter ATP-binding protein [Opitutaceae bacterium]|jgi:ABC-type polysaccharide/polyol phosphate transport system ATPase subunit|nr:ABC transporter ATP-binding protein [Opitutaceae bacterium]